jgi:AcrR family transcriptional regulator
MANSVRQPDDPLASGPQASGPEAGGAEAGGAEAGGAEVGGGQVGGARGRSRRGRQAEAERNDRRVLDAAREVFAACGADAPVSAVAERAGVGMGTLYRRYGSKADLLRHLCTLAMQQAIEAAEAGLAADDAWDGLAGYVRACVGFGSGALATLAGTIESTPPMWEISRRGRGLLDDLVTRARRDGGLRLDVTALDIAWLIELFSRAGPDWPEAGDTNVRDRLLALALNGLRSPEAAPLPGRPPSRRQYEDRWKARSAPTPDLRPRFCGNADAEALRRFRGNAGSEDC